MINNKESEKRFSVVKTVTLRFDIENFDNRVKHLAKHQIELRKENEKMIYEIIMNNGCKNTKQVHDILKMIYTRHNEQVKKEIQQKYEKGEFNDTEKEKQIEKGKVKPVTLRTVQNAIKNLEREGKLVKEGKRNFRLKNPSDIERYKIINVFSNSILEKIFQMPNNNQDIIKHLVNLIGTNVIFNFIIMYGIKTNNSIKEIESDYFFIADRLNTTIQLDKIFEFFIKSIESMRINKSNKIGSKENNVKILLEEVSRLYPSIIGDTTSIMKLFEHKKEN